MTRAACPNPCCVQAESQVSSGPGRVSKRRSRSSAGGGAGGGAQQGAGPGAGGGRESPIGAEREREFPTTKIGSTPCHAPHTQPDMAANQDNYNYHAHHPQQHGGRCGGGAGQRSVITGDLVQSRDFHYSVAGDQHAHQQQLYRRPRETAAFSKSRGEAAHSTQHGYSGAGAGAGYVEHKGGPAPSPYHSGTLRTSVRGLPDDSITRRGGGGGGAEEGLRAGRLDQNYMMVRAQSRLQDGYQDRGQLSHRSDSRGDLLDSDHSSIYEHGLYYQPGQYSGFVRTCDGKFIRTSLPQHDFETLDTNFYRQSGHSAAMHGTMRRPSKSRHQSHGSVSGAGAGAGQDYCCPTRDSDAGPGSLRASDQLQQSYATLRGRKYTEKSCGGRGGVGDNYGRNTLTHNFMEDARSVHSLADDFFLPVSASAGTSGRGGAQQQQQLAQEVRHLKSLSRSTDKSLDSLGLEAEDAECTVAGLGGLSNLASLRSDEILATMLKREPPDGKEKPEPPKHQKLENSSRKNSKCDLLEVGGAGAGAESGHAPLAKTDSGVSAVSKRDSAAAPQKPDPANNYLDSSNILTDEDLVSERLKDW